MLEPIMAQLQHKLFESVLSQFQQLLSTQQTTGNYSSDSGTFVPRSSEFDALIEDAAQRYNLDADLLKAVAHAESNLSPTAVSYTGAKGLMQLMDGTAQMLGVHNSFDPAQNVDGGARYLKAMLDRYNGDTSLALAAYNAGPGAVDKWGGIPPYAETQAYVPRILTLSQQYHDWTA